MDELERLGRQVARARMSHGWSQEQLARKAKFANRQAITDIENGVRHLRALEILRIAKATKHPPEFFFADGPSPISAASTPADIEARLAAHEARLTDCELRLRRLEDKR
jgi:transcriptional regulator with XRE-family HTH domain